MKLNILEYADMIGKGIVIYRRCPTNAIYTGYKFYCHFEHCELKAGSFLHGTYGDGKTITLAVQDYSKKISGKTIVFHAMDEKMREEYKVPLLNTGVE